MYMGLKLKENRPELDRARNLYEIYQSKRNELNRLLATSLHQRYTHIIASKNSNELWKTINWSGDINRTSPTNSPSVMAANLASAYAESFMIYIDSMGPKDHKK